MVLVLEAQVVLAFLQLQLAHRGADSLAVHVVDQLQPSLARQDEASSGNRLESQGKDQLAGLQRLGPGGDLDRRGAIALRPHFQFVGAAQIQGHLGRRRARVGAVDQDPGSIDRRVDRHHHLDRIRHEHQLASGVGRLQPVLRGATLVAGGQHAERRRAAEADRTVRGGIDSLAIQPHLEPRGLGPHVRLEPWLVRDGAVASVAKDRDRGDRNDHHQRCTQHEGPRRQATRRLGRGRSGARRPRAGRGGVGVGRGRRSGLGCDRLVDAHRDARLVQRCREARSAFESLVLLLGQCAPQDAFDRRVYRRVQLAGIAHVLVDDPVQDGRGRFAREGFGARQHLVEHGTQGEQIAPTVERLVPDLLGRQVGRRTAQLGALGPRQTRREADPADHPRVGDAEQVGGPHVAVDEAGPVHLVEPPGHARDEVDCGRGGQQRVRAAINVEGCALEPLRHDVRDALCLVDVERGDEVGVLESHERAAVAPHALGCLVSLRRGQPGERLDQLDRDLAVGCRVVGQQDPSHGAPPPLPEDPVSAQRFDVHAVLDLRHRLASRRAHPRLD
jgi:hypothetical protein